VYDLTVFLSTFLLSVGAVYAFAGLCDGDSIIRIGKNVLILL